MVANLRDTLQSWSLAAGRHVQARRGRRGGVFRPHLFHDQSEPVRARQGVAARDEPGGPGRRFAVRSAPVPDRNCPTRHALDAALGRIAVIDLGSNSLRLVVFERLGATLFAARSTKRSCARSGAASRATGRLNPDGVELALSNLRALCRAGARARRRSPRDHRHRGGARRQRRPRLRRRGRAPAAACRYASSTGPKRRGYRPPGCWPGFRDADGVVADLGGGSVELVRVDAAVVRAANRRRHQPAARPVAPGRTRRQKQGVPISSSAGSPTPPVLAAARARTCTWSAAHGGPSRGCTWSRRSIRCTSSTNTRYRDRMPRAFSTSSPASPAARSTASPRSAAGGSKLLPVAALILRRLIAAGKPRRDRVLGLRAARGLCLRAVAERARWNRGEPDGDALIASCKGIALSQSRWSGDGDRLHRWIAPLFSGPGLADRDAARRRLHRAACWLSDIGLERAP